MPDPVGDAGLLPANKTVRILAGVRYDLLVLLSATLTLYRPNGTNVALPVVDGQVFSLRAETWAQMKVDTASAVVFAVVGIGDPPSFSPRPQATQPVSGAGGGLVVRPSTDWVGTDAVSNVDNKGTYSAFFAQPAAGLYLMAVQFYAVGSPQESAICCPVVLVDGSNRVLARGIARGYQDPANQTSPNYSQWVYLPLPAPYLTSGSEGGLTLLVFHGTNNPVALAADANGSAAYLVVGVLA